MDTKSKKISRSVYLKVFAFLFVIITVTYSLATGFEILIKTEGGRKLLYDNFYDELYARRDYSVTHYLETLLKMKNEDYIRSEAYLSNDGFSDAGEDDYYNIRRNRINSDISQFDMMRRLLGEIEGIYYYAQNGDVIFKNSSYETYEEFSSFRYNNITDSKLFGSSDGKYTIYIAYDDNYIIEIEEEFLEHKSAGYENILIRCLIILIAGLLAFIYLVFVCGRDEYGNLIMNTIDSLWTDVNVIILILLAGLFLIICDGLSMGEFFSTSRLVSIVFVSAIAVFTSFGMMLFFSLVRHIKNKTLFKNSFCGAVFRKTAIIFRKTSIIFTKYTTIKIRWVTIYVILMAVVLIFGRLSFIILAIFIYFFIKNIIMPFEKIKNGVISVKDGDLNYKIEIDAEGDFKELAENINSISDGLKNSVEKQIRSEKLKTELITNVSHDLKTPLTSIINYTDLLSKEELTPQIANEYVSVLKQKSQKLKLLTEDLFEISKVQSGSIEANPQILDVTELIEQIFAEIDVGTVNFRLNLNNVKIFADGKLMSRVFENLISNIVKYSMENTRAYIDGYEKDEKAYIEFKNIANYEMNFSGFEIIERFKRGDEARTTEGSGLGLAIAQSYTQATGGSFEIFIDGDLFKVRLIF